MIKKTLFLGLLIICLFFISFSADPFYTNLLFEGKAQFQAGKFDEALESFKIAEFGLVDEKDFVPELYFYFALTHYKKGEIGESRALMDKMKSVLGEVEYRKAKKPNEIEHDILIMIRALDYLGQPGAKPGSLPFFNLFYETWDLLREKKLEMAEANIKRLDRMGGDKNRLYFLEGFLAFQKGDFKRCLSRLEKIDGPLPAEFGEDASFYLAFSYLKRGDLQEGEKWAQKIKDPDHVHQLMVLMDEIKAGNQEKHKK